MAEDTGKPTPATDPKAAEKPAGKPGPVKPPVLEGTARPSAGAKPADSSAPSASAKAPTEKTSPTNTKKSEPPASASEHGGSPWLAGLLGGVIGLGAAYGLAWGGLWPSPPQAPTPADPRLAQFASAIPELETVTGTVQDELATLTGRVGTLETALAEAPAADGSADPAMAEQLADLSARLDALAASAPDAASQSAANQALLSEIETLRSQVATTQSQLDAAQTQIAALTQTTTETASADAATIRLPLIFSALESAFDTGRAFDAELAALRQALPDSLIPEAVAGRAASGLPRPETVANQLQAALPDMLAGRPANADAGWQDATADWFRGLVAMRPTGAVEGNSPDAIVARLEAAVERRDFVAALTELQALPQSMQQGAAAFADDVESLSAAQTFLGQLRQEVLAGGSGA